MNTSWASEVTNMNSDALNGANGSLYTIDRFWILNADAYTTKPNVRLSFGYDDAANEIGATNTITEANLAAQYFNTDVNDWQGLEGTANTIANIVSPVNVTGTSYYNTWVLTDQSTPLPIDLFELEALKSDDKVYLTWDIQNANTIDHFVIERSHSTTNFEVVGYVEKGKDFEFYDRQPLHGNNYYRIKAIEQNEQSSFSNVAVINFSKTFSFTLYPNPTQNIAFISIKGEYNHVEMNIYDLNGRQVLAKSFGKKSTIMIEEVKDLSDGLYIINIRVDGVYMQSFKLNKVR